MSISKTEITTIAEKIYKITKDEPKQTAIYQIEAELMLLEFKGCERGMDVMMKTQIKSLKEHYDKIHS